MRIYFYNYFIVGSIFIQISFQYIERTIEDDDLCSLIKKRKISLGQGELSGLLVKQRQLNRHPIDWELNMKCKFHVVPSHSGEGIIAVIQHLIFRKNSSDECIDYVQFTRRDGSKSPKFCGRFNAAVHMDHNFVDPTQPVSLGNSFVAEIGDLDVEIFVDKRPLLYDEEMDLSITFTSYSHCSKVLKRDTLYRPCSVTRKEFCIFSGFFGDTYINCPLPDCKDESGCSKSVDMMETSDIGETVLIASLSTVTLLFALFILLLWIFKTYKIFCWSENFASASPAAPEQHTTTRIIEMEDHVQQPQESQGPSNVEDQDKDLPPSYDSLFPAR